MLLGAPALGPPTFTWGAFTVFLATAAVTLCAGHLVGFHRRLIHRSFDCPKWLERALVWLGTAVGMGGPIWTIRLHDSRDWAQRQPDCHWFQRHAKPLLVDGCYYLHFRLRLKNPPGFDPGRRSCAASARVRAPRRVGGRLAVGPRPQHRRHCSEFDP